MSKALDVQVGGDHYKILKIQPMEYSMANGLNACQHTIIKYVTRYASKNGVEDLKKARHTIDLLIDFLEAEQAGGGQSDVGKGLYVEGKVCPIPKAEPIEAPWIEHDGSGCPVPEGTKVEVRYRESWGADRNGPFQTDGGPLWAWPRPSGNPDNDIVAYRLA